MDHFYWLKYPLEEQVDQSRHHHAKSVPNWVDEFIHFIRMLFLIMLYDSKFLIRKIISIFYNVNESEIQVNYLPLVSTFFILTHLFDFHSNFDMNWIVWHLYWMTFRIRFKSYLNILSLILNPIQISRSNLNFERNLVNKLNWIRNINQTYIAVMFITNNNKCLIQKNPIAHFSTIYLIKTVNIVQCGVCYKLI